MKIDKSSRWVDEYQKLGALWMHDGNPRRPHALLTSGKHSSGFFNSGLVTSDPRLIVEACVDLAGAVCEQVNVQAINYVVGPAMGAIVIAHCLARALNITDRPCLSSFTEKEASPDDPRRMVLKRTSLQLGDEVLVVEDVLTTGGSAEQTIEAVTVAGGHAAPVVAVLVNRSGLSVVRGGRRIVALIDHPMPTWKPEECPMCRGLGSEAIRPKGAENWARLNATY